MALKSEMPTQETGLKEKRACEKRRLARGYLMFFLRLSAVILFFWLVFSQVFLLWRMQGTEMIPALKDGDLLLAYRLVRDYRSDDVVIYTAEGIRHAGRIVASAGDLVDITDDGQLLVNGTARTGEIYFPTYFQEGEESISLVVPEHCFYILGDYRSSCTDSRQFGSIPENHVEGKLITLLRRREL